MKLIADVLEIRSLDGTVIDFANAIQKMKGEWFSFHLSLACERVASGERSCHASTNQTRLWTRRRRAVFSHGSRECDRERASLVTYRTARIITLISFRTVFTRCRVHRASKYWVIAPSSTSWLAGGHPAVSCRHQGENGL